MSRAYKPEYARHVEAFEKWARAQEFYALFDECLVGWAGAASHYEPRIAAIEAEQKQLQGVLCIQQKTINDLTAENAELRRDAERYRWLRDNNNGGIVEVSIADTSDDIGWLYKTEDMDAAIDACYSQEHRG